MEDLNELRKEIDTIDKAMVDLFEKRMDVSRRVAEYKIANGKKVLDRERKKNQTAIDALKQEYEENHEIYAEEIVRHMIEV